jgi:hypothetical protein
LADGTCTTNGNPVGVVLVGDAALPGEKVSETSVRTGAFDEKLQQESPLVGRRRLMTEIDEMFESVVRPGGELAGVFEYDGDTNYFYLYRTGEDGDKVLDSIHVLSGRPDFLSTDLDIRWTADETKVGLFIRGELWAVFDSHSRTKHGGNYRPGARSELSPVVKVAFAPSS